MAYSWNIDKQAYHWHCWVICSTHPHFFIFHNLKFWRGMAGWWMSYHVSKAVTIEECCLHILSLWHISSFNITCKKKKKKILLAYRRWICFKGFIVVMSHIFSWKFVFPIETQENKFELFFQFYILIINLYNNLLQI